MDSSHQIKPGSCPSERHSVRRFLCTRCKLEVYVCSHCDRAQQYCSQACAKQQRKENRRLTSHKYQTSEQGRINHNRRQQRYRNRRARVTHRGSIKPEDPALIATQCNSPSATASDSSPTLRSNRKVCHFCHKTVPDRVRRGWLKPRHSEGRQSRAPRHLFRERPRL